jgi:hypothetical protein
MVPELQEMLAASCAQAILAAEASLQNATVRSPARLASGASHNARVRASVPAQMGVGHSLLYNVTVNRRADISPYLRPDRCTPGWPGSHAHAREIEPGRLGGP